MIDIHSHVIPGIDDGAGDIETALEMLKIAQEDGIETIVATPHFYRNKFECNLEEVKKHVENLKAAVKKENIAIEIIQGQEIYIDKCTTDLYKERIIGTINGSKYMLIETSLTGAKPKDLMENIYELKLLGITPIIAHPERYEFIIKDNMEINEFIKEDCLFQITSTSVQGLFGKEVKNTAENLIKNGICNFLGSDAHTTERRCPKIKEAFEDVKRLNEDVYEMITKNSKALLNNEDINLKMGYIAKKKKFFEFWK